ncbi:MAG: DNA mismatch repair endonuclease MutL [Clostridia bacterium]|nr:DNA mismatch repair endonuclease MutL [Clostridia bacterium]
MGNIVLLDDLTINKIAAGEVIERPASVVKEMVENSIDAGATNITVEIRNGGISYIKITDNGKGIPEDDMEMSFERHATSKIRSADDLDTVTSMGFRGEALASIAAIAKVEMVSKTANQENGYKVVIEGGDVLEKTEVGSPVGTSITVTNLFYNTPVRYKFLKKDFTEAGYIEDAITRIALIHPEIAIKLINTGKTIIQTNGNGDLKTVIYSIYGKDVAGGIIETDYIYENIHVYGVVGKPEIARSNRANQLFFVNKRYIRDKSLSAAVEKAYKGMIPIGKFSFLVLNIDIAPNKVDVNVHPAKLEVRFQDEGEVFKAIYHAIKVSLLKADLVADTEHTSSEKRENSGLFGNKPINNSMVNVEKNRGGLIQKTENNELMQTEDKPLEQNNNYLSPELLKSQEVLRKLQEMKEQMIKETPQLKIEQTPKLEYQSSQEDEETEAKVEAKEEQTQYELEEQQTSEPQEENKMSEHDGEQQSDDSQLENKMQKENEEQKNDDIQIEKTQEEKEEKQEEENQIENEEKQDNVQEEEQSKKEAKIFDESGKLSEIQTSEYSQEFEEMYLKMFGTKPVRGNNIEIPQKEEEDLETIGNISVFDELEEYQKKNYKFIGIVFNTYIILEIDKEMYILDQHAAHERILYEKVKQNYYDDENKDSQLMLLPDIITLTHKEMEIARDNMLMFKKAGFMVEEFGENTLKLTGVPEMCINLETKEMFLETLDEINTVSRTAKQELEERFIATVACKAAVKANMALTKEEVDALMEKLLELPNPFTCPHGRPTVIKMSKYDIERKFARK